MGCPKGYYLAEMMERKGRLSLAEASVVLTPLSMIMPAWEERIQWLPLLPTAIFTYQPSCPLYSHQVGGNGGCSSVGHHPITFTPYRLGFLGELVPVFSFKLLFVLWLALA